MSVHKTDNMEPNIREHLREKDVQERVRLRMLDAHARATVTISRAADLFGFTESRLREWEKRGLLQVDRSAQTPESKGHRQYTVEDLDRLALIQELLKHGFSLSDITPDVIDVWRELAGDTQPETSASERHDINEAIEGRHDPIDTQVENADGENFWRFFVSQIVRLTLLLISEEAPGTITGLILPLARKEHAPRITSPYDIGQAGPSLVGWLGTNQALYASHEPFPTFEYPSDFRIEYLPGWNTATCPEPIIILQRRTKTPFFSEALVQTIQHLFDLLYTNRNEWQTIFGLGMRDRVDHVTNFWQAPTVTDSLLDRLTNIIVELGGEEHGRRRWKFCNLFLPQERTLPLQQRTLTIRAHSHDAPGPISTITLDFKNPGLTYRAYQSGQVLYRPHLVSKDPILAYGDFEETTRSAIALPLIGSDGMVAGAIYIASEHADAFPLPYQRALRLLAKIAEELLVTYQARVYVDGKLSELITRPHIVDSSFADFYSEEDFLNELESLLSHILHEQDEEHLQGKEVSFICIDIDNQSTLAIKSGDRAARNLSREVGLLLQGRMLVQSNPDYRKVFHTGADHYYLKLVGMSLEDARNLARQLRRLLRGDYRVDVRRDGKPISREEKLLLNGVTVRMGVSRYPFWKLKEVQKRYPPAHAVADTRKLILDNLDQSLSIASAEGGDCIVTWDDVRWGHWLLESGEPQSG